MKSSPNQIPTHNAGWRTQFRFAGNVFWSGVFGRWAKE
jgi:hypothetical protein